MYFSLHSKYSSSGYSVTVARVLWEDLVSVRIRVPRNCGCRITALPQISNLMTGVQLPSPAPRLDFPIFDRRIGGFERSHKNTQKD